MHAPQLRIPGPTPVPRRVVRAAGRPMINPRGPEFAQLLRACCDGVRWALQTHNDVLLFPASGTGGLEAAVANLLSPGEPALFCTTGWFGDLWASIATAYGADVRYLRGRWGEPVDHGELARALDTAPEIGKVFVTHSETSTGVLNDLSAIAAIVKARGRLLAVDSVSGVPCHPLPLDALGVDVAVTASQKGWLAPPGLAMVAVSEAAMRAAAQARCPSWYFDFRRQRQSLARACMLTTPPISVMYALEEGVAMLREEGLQPSWARHARTAQTLRAGLRAAGLDLIARADRASNTVTAVRSPVRSRAVLEALLHDLRVTRGVVVAHGLGQLEGRSFRIGHLGRISARELDDLLGAVTDVMCIRELAA